MDSIFFIFVFIIAFAIGHPERISVSVSLFSVSFTSGCCISSSRNSRNSTEELHSMRMRRL